MIRQPLHLFEMKKFFESGRVTKAKHETEICLVQDGDDLGRVYENLWTGDKVLEFHFVQFFHGAQLCIDIMQRPNRAC